MLKQEWGKSMCGVSTDQQYVVSSDDHAHFVGSVSLRTEYPWVLQYVLLGWGEHGVR